MVRQNDFGRHEKERFVERSLVETRQIMKNVATLMRRRYGNSSAVIGLNSELTKEMRQYLGFEHKNRDINDYHHAQDALCLGVAGQFAVNRGFFDNGAVSDGAANAYNIYLQDYLRGYREKLKAGDRKHGKASVLLSALWLRRMKISVSILRLVRLRGVRLIKIISEE